MQLRKESECTQELLWYGFLAQLLGVVLQLLRHTRRAIPVAVAGWFCPLSLSPRES